MTEEERGVTGEDARDRRDVRDRGRTHVERGRTRVTREGHVDREGRACQEGRVPGRDACQEGRVREEGPRDGGTHG